MNGEFTRPKLTPKFHKAITICSNPIKKDTKHCVVFFKELEDFNTKVDQLEYAISNDNGIFEVDICKDPENAYMEECRVYE